MGSSPTSGNMDCSTAEKNIISLFKGALKGNVLRRTYYHLTTCERCKEVILDEFSFYATFNDLDTSLDFNYHMALTEKMKNIKKEIETNDLNLKIKYTFISIFLCIFCVFIVALAIRVMF